MSALTLVSQAAQDDARWQQWRQQYADSSHKTATQMRIVFTVALLSALAFVARAFLS